MNVVFLGSAAAMFAAAAALGSAARRQTAPAENGRLLRFASILFLVAGAVFAVTAFLID